MESSAEGGEFAAPLAVPDVQDADRIDPIVLDGQLVALAARRRCYLLTDDLTPDLTPDQLRLVAAMCLCSREVRAGRLNGPFTTELAARWAERYTSLGG